jgi:hypothetical protein
MRIAEFTPQPQTLEHPACSWCDAIMRLATIEPYKSHQDKRTFQCPECRHVVVEIVKIQ